MLNRTKVYAIYDVLCGQYTKKQLRNDMIEHKQILAKLVELKLVDIEEVHFLISTLNNKKIRELIMNLKSKSGDKIFIAIEQSQQGDLILWVKRKFKVEAELVLVYIAAQLVKLHRDSILTKLDLDMQKVIKTVQWREGVLLYLEKVEIEDTSKIQLDWLIDIEELNNMERKEKSVALDDISLVSFSKQSFCSLNLQIKIKIMINKRRL